MLSLSLKRERMRQPSACSSSDRLCLTLYDNLVGVVGISLFDTIPQVCRVGEGKFFTFLSLLRNDILLGGYIKSMPIQGASRTLQSMLDGVVEGGREWRKRHLTEYGRLQRGLR